MRNAKFNERDMSRTQWTRLDELGEGFMGRDWMKKVREMRAIGMWWWGPTHESKLQSTGDLSRFQRTSGCGMRPGQIDVIKWGRRNKIRPSPNVWARWGWFKWVHPIIYWVGSSKAKIMLPGKSGPLNPQLISSLIGVHRKIGVVSSKTVKFG